MSSNHYDSVIVALNGTIDGANKTFTTPGRYVAGSIVLIINGQVYKPDEDDYGWSETNDTTIEINTAPLTDDVVQAFYKDKDTLHDEGTPFDNVKGSPFHPDGILP